MLRHQVQIMLTEGYSCIFSRVHHFRVCFRGRESRIGRHGEHLRLDWATQSNCKRSPCLLYSILLGSREAVAILVDRSKINTGCTCESSASVDKFEFSLTFSSLNSVCEKSNFVCTWCAILLQQEETWFGQWVRGRPLYYILMQVFSASAGPIYVAETDKYPHLGENCPRIWKRYIRSFHETCQ